MTLSRRAAPLLTSLLLLAAGSHAQTAPGQPTLDEQKVQIWCATARYVYDDNGRSNLQDKLNCGGSLKAFENSIKADSQKVYSLLYQPLEGRGTMYKGLSSNDSRLQKLTSEIIARLKSSPARRADPARMQRLVILETALNSYVNSGTPIGNLAGAETPADNSDTTADSDEASAAAPAEAAEAEVGLSGATPAASRVSESLMDKLFAPLALILALLGLVLFWLLNRKVGTLADRVGRHRADIDAVKLSSRPSPAAATADHLTPAQHREVEQLVTRRVAEALDQHRQPSKAPASPVRPEAASPPVPPTPPAAPEMRVAETPVSFSELPAPPAAILAGSPAAAPRDEFESLVPPVQLPQPTAIAPEPVAELPAKLEPAGPAQYTRYVKVPVNGAFSEYDLSDEPQHDSIYEIHFDPQWPELATFGISQNPAIHAYAIQSAQYSLREACRYQQPSGPVTRIVTEEEGVLRKVAGSWQIEQKAAIRFE